MRPGDRFTRVTGWRYVWAYLTVARFSWVELLVISILGRLIMEWLW